MISNKKRFENIETSINRLSNMMQTISLQMGNRSGVNGDGSERRDRRRERGARIPGIIDREQGLLRFRRRNGDDARFGDVLKGCHREHGERSGYDCLGGRRNRRWDDGDKGRCYHDFKPRDESWERENPFVTYSDLFHQDRSESEDGYDSPPKYDEEVMVELGEQGSEYESKPQELESVSQIQSLENIATNENPSRAKLLEKDEKETALLKEETEIEPLESLHAAHQDIEPSDVEQHAERTSFLEERNLIENPQEILGEETEEKTTDDLSNIDYSRDFSIQVRAKEIESGKDYQGSHHGYWREVNFEQKEGKCTKVLVAIEKQRVYEKEEESQKTNVVSEAGKKAHVCKIQRGQKLRERKWKMVCMCGLGEVEIFVLGGYYVGVHGGIT